MSISRAILFFAMLALAVGWPGTIAKAADPANAADPGIAIVALKGRVKVQRAGTTAFVNAATNLVLRLGDTLSTGDFSEATLQFSDKSLGRVDELTDLVISKPGTQGERYQIEVREGGFYLLNRDKATDQKFRTPVASGAILGTEFAVRVAHDGTTRVFLFEGAISLSNQFGGVALAANEESRVDPGVKPTKSAMVDAVAPVQWTLYYPAVLPPSLLAGVSPALAATAEKYASGDLLAAIAAIDPTVAPGNAPDRLLLAQLALAAGQPQRALPLLAGDQGPAAGALRSLVDVVAGRRPSGAPDGSPASSLVAGYAAQAGFDLPEALRLSRVAVAADPEFGFGWVRVAELEFALGNARAAREALDTATRRVPRNAHARALRGFVAAARGHLGSARTDFEEAIAIDPHYGNGWLGRGLCRIKSGDVAGGRRDLQTAAALEPTRGLTRSYLGKAFAAEHDPARAAHELDRARELDPMDPTGWLYGALVDQQSNRVNDAIRALERSKELNERRNVYRSRQLLDQDLAVRGANLAAVYRDAGMTEWALHEAGRAVAYDYANPSAHLFLSGAYDSLRDPRLFNLRYETPWFSELLVANLLAPVGAGTLSQNVSLQEYSRLLESDGVGMSSLTEFRGDGIWNERASQFGTFGGSSYALDVAHRHEAGHVRNTDLTQTDVYGKIKQAFGPSDQLFVEVLYSTYENGDVTQYYDPAKASPTYRFRERQEPNLFAGWNHEWSPGNHTLFLAGHLDDRVAYTDTDAPIPLVRRPRPDKPPTAVDLPGSQHYGLSYGSTFAAWTAELQQIATLGRHTLVAGGRYQAGDTDTTAGQDPFPNQFPISGRLTNSVETVNARLGRVSAYAYDTWSPLDPIHLTAGIAYERVEYPRGVDFAPIAPGGERHGLVSPKLGALWSVATNTHLRAAWTKSLGGTFYDGSVRLEPVQVAGFTQSYRSLVPESVAGLAPGTEFETVGVGLDHRFPTRTYVSVVGEWLRSDATQTVGAFDYAAQGRFEVIPTTLRRRLPYDERSVSAGLNQLLGEHWSAGLAYRWSEADLDFFYDQPYAAVSKTPNASYQATLHQVTGLLQYTHHGGFYAQLVPRWNRQSTRGFAGQPGDDFWQFDAFVGYRFLQRRVDVRLGVLNLGDRDYRLQPLNVHEEFPRERMFYASLRLQF
ncbi:MAG: hypothetical protein DVB31_12550 [Verrucomicrobia bacterium]|nr:MAG: hypothetical protein DVB31_12550 [Verrucomicrobiota bacterium]